jgi:photosystem II stability/assembly factor-like uncharacterized protein
MKSCNVKFAFLMLISIGAMSIGCSNDMALPPVNDLPTPGDGIWRSLGPYGIDVSALAVAPTDPMLLFAASDEGDVYKSDDAGMSWEKVAVLGTAVRTLVFHPTNSETVYVGTDLFGVQRTVDGGETWTVTSNGLVFDPFVYALAVHPSDPTAIYAGTFKSLGTGGVYKSTDGGLNWQASREGMTDGFVLSVAIDPNQPNIVYAGTFNGTDALYKSTDAGANWTAINNGLGRNDIFVIAINPQQSDVLYVATGGSGIYKSTDGGSSWRAMNSGLTTLDVRALILDPQSPETLYSSGASGVFETTNGGQSWTPMSSGLSNLVIVKLARDSINPDMIYAGATGVASSQSRGSFMGGVFKTTPGGQSWSFSSGGMRSADVRAIVIDPGNPSVIYAGTFGRGVMRSSDGGESWNSAFEGINVGLDDPQILDLDLDPSISGTLVAATFANGIYKSSNRGINWRNVWQGGRAQTLIRDPGNPHVLYAATLTGILKSTDRGDNWLPTTFDKGGIFALVVNPADPSTIYAAVNAAEPEGGVYKSTDAGASWVKRSNGITNPLVRALAISPQDENILYAGTLRSKRPASPPHFFRTTDGGENWEKASDLEFESFALLIDPQQPDVIYSANLGSGAIKSTDGGVTWTEANDGLLNPRLLALEFDPTDPNIIYAGSVGDGIFRVRF